MKTIIVVVVLLALGGCASLGDTVKSAPIAVAAASGTLESVSVCVAQKLASTWGTAPTMPIEGGTMFVVGQGAFTNPVATVSVTADGAHSQIAVRQGASTDRVARQVVSIVTPCSA